MLPEEIVSPVQLLPNEKRGQLIRELREDEFTEREREFAKQFAGVTEIPIYILFGCYEAAATLQKLLDEAGGGEFARQRIHEMQKSNSDGH